MFKLLLGLLGKGGGNKTVAGNLAWDIREAIKGKELDPEKLIELQTKINLAEASHRTLFVAGWRPFCGWIAGLALMYSTIIAPILGIWFTVPPIDNSLLSTVLLGMLGMAGIRGYEKTKGVQREK